jgi:hypothetical protein
MHRHSYETHSRASQQFQPQHRPSQRHAAAIPLPPPAPASSTHPWYAPHPLSLTPPASARSDPTPTAARLLQGTDIFSSLQLVQASLSDLAPWNFSLSGLIMNLTQAAIAALPAAWVLRSWLAATCTLATTAAAGTARAAGAAADATSLAQRAAAAGLSGAAAAAVAAVRLTLLLVAHGMVAAGAAGWTPAAAVLIASWALLAAAHGKSAARELQQHTQLAALLAAAEASWLVLSSAAALPVLLPAAGVYAACWALLQMRELGSRMQQRQLQPGSAAQVHLTLKTESGAVLDSTWDGLARPLEATAAADAASRPPAQVAIDALAQEEQRQGEQQEQQQQQAQHRLSVFLPVVASRLSGRYPGESFELQLTGPGLAVYHNPELVWWQPKEEVVKKLGQLPQAGHVFWYPIRDGAWVPVTVARVSEQYVELDAAAALAEGPLVLQVQLQRH